MKMRSNRCLLVMSGAFHTDGGIAAVNRLTIKALAEEGYRLDILSLIEKDASADPRYLPQGAQVRWRGFAGDKVSFTLAVWRAVLQNAYAHVFVDHVNLASILYPLRWLRRARYIVWLCGIDVFPPRPDWQGRLGLRGAHRGLAISEFTFHSVTDRFPDVDVKVCDLSLDPVRHASLTGPQAPASGGGVSLQALDGSHAELGTGVILHVGRMVPGDRYKGQESLIRAFPLVCERHPHAQLVLAGQGDDMPRLKALAGSLPFVLQAQIFFPGFVPDDLLDRVYQLSYVFAMPSIGEGFGLVYLEAMSRGKACLGANVDATPYVIRDGVTGLLVNDPRSPQQVASTLNWFLSHSEETREMGRKGYELVQSYYLFPHFQQRFWEAVLQT